MSEARRPERAGGAPARLVALVLAIVVGTLAAVAWAAQDAARSRVPKPAHESDPSTQCVEPPEVMRRVHMDMLKHQRDRTVHQGVRGVKVSLSGCVDCHAGKPDGPARGSVTGSPEAFCEGCHSYVAVKLDCFECHSSKPSSAARAAAGGSK